MNKVLRNRIMYLGLLLLASIAFFLTYNIWNINIDYALPRRLMKLATIILVAIAVGYSALIFQTITNNKILTPSIMGYESVFILFQTLIVFYYGDKTFKVVNQTDNFLIAIGFMLLFSFVLYFLLFKKGKNNIYHLLLVGLILGTLFSTLSQFVQIIIDPNEFSMMESFMFVSFNRMNTDLLSIAAILLIITIIAAQFYIKYLDVIALGREQAINLGLNYHRLIQIYMLIISLLVSVSTALVGPIAFLGIMVTNLCYELFTSSKHKYMVWICSMLACVFLVIGQSLTEYYFNFSTTTSIVINFVGGVYFVYIVLKSSQKK